MNTKECPGCAVEVEANSESCPICGYDFPKQPVFLRIMVWVMVMLLLLWYFF